MKQLLILAAFLVLYLAIPTKSHEEIECMACGARTEGPESPFTGECSDQNDVGNKTTCEHEFQSCMTSIITKDGKTTYYKNCGNSGMYHASGCLNVDDTDDGVTGTICFCETPNCNTNFDMHNGVDKVVIPIVTIIVSVSSLMLLN